ncbi:MULTISPECIES: ABC transporter ATP-binding protein [Oceanotoga]|jgi:ATP-binding cassette subfamily B protein|uniref:ATP-binding cassette subfamily B protein n=1 Tax=Oceanotoga teriensis TaxID=515440 RepID=A0AA45C6M7_9BACT|nr:MULTISPECIES: ABC transporter ATP-binding protein [Oceanotoga]MDN5342562.1 ATP-binding cassette, subfamily bacterial IrtA/YbtP [Oceanotoga sp.]MDO7977058.1 ABC transporter ATP-binding protein/permease [Oceanotoga teriensis]PWJ92174.1 ATP-binding cassette subfamily B protein [Oceanotoga teriensis]
MQDKEKRKSNFKFLLEISGKEKIKLYTSAIFSVLSTVLSMVPYIIVYYIVLELFKPSIDFERIKNLAFITCIFVIIRVILFLSSGVFSHIAAFTILYELRMKAVKHMAKLNMGFFTTNTTGNIKKAINEDIEKLENFIAHQIPDLSAAAVAPIIFLIFLFTLNWKLAFILLIPIVLGFLLQTFWILSAKQNMIDYHNLLSKLNSTIIQYINGMNIMKAFNLTSETFEKYKNTNKEYADYWCELSKKQAPSYAIFSVLIDSGLLFIIPIGGLMYLNGSVNVSVYILFILMSKNFLSSFKNLLEFGMTFTMLLEGAGKVRDILDREEQSSGDKLLDKDIKGEIEYKNIKFKYDKEEVIKDISFKIKPKTTVALVGPSGSGKTTLGQLLGRFWDVDDGSITIDGVDIRDISFESLMNNTSFVFQDVFMLQDSIFENIRMGSDSSKEDIENAAKKAQIHDFIMSLPEKYDTLLGENGIKLSGGEKQRISIARAILKNTPIVVLDEVTSYSDIENESKIQIALRELLKNKTGIIIAHRLYTIKNSDNIIVLNEGKIQEMGTHDQLMNKEGLYKHLWNMYDYDLVKDEEEV